MLFSAAAQQLSWPDAVVMVTYLIVTGFGLYLLSRVLPR